MQIEVIGLKDLNNTLGNIKDKIEDTKPLMISLAHHLEEIVQYSFEKEQTPDGKNWSPIKYRKSDQSPDKILQDSGNMLDTLRSKATKTTAIVGFNAVANDFQYPLTHQFGTNKAGRKRNVTIEARPFMPIHKDGSLYDGVEDELMEIVENHLNQIV